MYILGDCFISAMKFSDAVKQNNQDFMEFATQFFVLPLLIMWAVTKTLVVCCIEVIILPTYTGIVINHYKDPY